MEHNSSLNIVIFDNRILHFIEGWQNLKLIECCIRINTYDDIFKLCNRMSYIYKILYSTINTVQWV